MKSDSKFSMKYDKQTSHQFSVLYQARYCAQEDISIAVCKDGIINMLDHPFSLKNFNISDCSLLATNCDSKLVVNSTNLYLFNTYNKNTLFYKFSESSKSFNVLPSILDERSRFSVCSFMQKIIVIGGSNSNESINSCMAYNCKINKWTYIASMNKSREDTSCIVFKGKIVVTGGWIAKRLGIRAFSSGFLKSVEAYCFHENKWTKLPDMLKERCDHGTVSIGNKMFVISRVDTNDSEVFDSITNKFTFLKRSPHIKDICYYSLQTRAINVGYNIHIFRVKEFEKKFKTSAFCYDVKKETWVSGDDCNLELFNNFTCAKMFKLQS